MRTPTAILFNARYHTVQVLCSTIHFLDISWVVCWHHYIVKPNVVFNIFKVLFHTQERNIFIQKTYKIFNVAGLASRMRLLKTNQEARVQIQLRSISTKCGIFQHHILAQANTKKQVKLGLQKFIYANILHTNTTSQIKAYNKRLTSTKQHLSLKNSAEKWGTECLTLDSLRYKKVKIK